MQTLIKKNTKKKHKKQRKQNHIKTKAKKTK